MLPHWLTSDVTGLTQLATGVGLVALVMIAGIFIFVPKDDGEREPTTVAHSRFASLSDLRKHKITNEIPATRGNAQRLQDDDAIFLGAFREPDDRKAPPVDLRYRGEMHLISFGAPGTSKSTSLAAVNLLLLRRSFLVVDVKGELFAISASARRRMGSKIILINPFAELLDVRPDMESDGWNPLAQLDPKSFEFYSKAKTIAEAVASISGDSKSDFFEASMIDLWAAFCMLERINNGHNAHLRNVRAAIAGSREEMLLALEQMKSSGIYALEVAGSAAYARLTDKNSLATSFADVIATTLKNTDFLNDDRLGYDMARGGAIDFQAMHTDLITVYLVVPVSQLNKQAKYLRMFVNLAIESFFDNSPRGETLPRVMFLIDEMGNLGRLPAVLRALTAIRSYRVQMFMFFQELGQIKAAYAKEWTQFFTGSGVINTLRISTGDTTTAEHLSKTCGNREAAITSSTVSAATSATTRAGASAQTATQVHALMPLEEFFRLRRFETINIIEPCPWPIRSYARGYWELFEPSDCDANPYYRG
jgi:type IV secretion system protein VirD4